MTSVAPEEQWDMRRPRTTSIVSEVYDEGTYQYPWRRRRESLIASIKSDLLSTTKQDTIRIKYKGIVLTIASAFCFSLAAACIKALPKELTLPLLSIKGTVTMHITVPLLLAQCRRLPEFVPPGKLLYLLLRAVLGSIALGCFYYTFANLPLGDAIVITFTTPIFVSILAYFVLREPFGYVTAGSMVVAFVGVILIARPPFMFPEAHTHKEKWKPVLVGIIGSMVSSNNFILLRLLREVHMSVVLFYLGLVMTVVACLGQLVVAGKPCLPSSEQHRLLALAAGLLDFSSGMFFTFALKWEQAGVVAIAGMTGLFFSVLWDLAFFQKEFEILSAAGTTLISASVFVTACRKYAMAQPLESRSKFTSWLLK